MTQNVSVFVEAEYELGESPMWCERDERFYWVDILGQSLWSATESGDNLKNWKFDCPVASVLPSVGTGVVLLLSDRVVRFDPQIAVVTECWAKPQEGDQTRFNDAKVDTKGVLWAGTMRSDGTGEKGSFFRFSPNGEILWADGNYSVTNGPAFSPDGRFAYLADSMNRIIYRLILCPQTGMPLRKHMFTRVDQFEGVPDGMTVDADGNLWVAMFGAARVAIYAESGSRIETIPLPVPMATSVCFGGRQMNRLLITTARIAMHQSVTDAFPLSGSVFLVETSTTGFHQNRLDMGS